MNILYLKKSKNKLYYINLIFGIEISTLENILLQNKNVILFISYILIVF